MLVTGAYIASVFVPRRNKLIPNYPYQQANKRPEKQTNNDLVNERVRFPEVLLIGPNGEQLGTMSSRDAYLKSVEYGLDLLCVAPQAKPPVCKILNYGKYRYEAQKKDKENKRNQTLHTIDVKEIRITPQIGEHDLMTKANAATKFLKGGDKVKVAVKFRGRQLAHIDVGEVVLDKFIAALEEYSTIEKPKSMEGKWMVVTLASKFKK